MSDAITKFNDLLNRGQADAALRHLSMHPELTDVTTQDGYNCLSAAARLVDSEALVQAFFQKNAVWPDETRRIFSVLTEAAAALHPQSLRVLLKYASGVQKEAYAVSLHKVRRLACENSALRATRRKAYECATQLAEAGALKSLISGIRTVLENDLYNPPFGDGEEWKEHVCYLMRLGADVKPWLKAEDKMVNPEREDYIPAAVENIESIIADAQKRLGGCMKKMTPEELLEKFSAAPVIGLPEVTRAQAAKSLRGELYTLLSADRADMLLAPEYWKRHGGDTAMLSFAGELQELIPDYLSDLRGRINSAGLLREAATPREGSVTVSYARGGGVEAGRG